LKGLAAGDKNSCRNISLVSIFCAVIKQMFLDDPDRRLSILSLLHSYTRDLINEIESNREFQGT